MNDEKGTKAGLSLPTIRDIVIIISLAAVVIKTLFSDINFDFSAFSFTDLLALIMSIFSIWLSAIFYFKANEASAQFYNNTYLFTKDTAEMLGRIESGFGEKLSNLNESYTGLKSNLDNFRYNNRSEDIATSEEDIREKQKEYEAKIEELLQKSQLDAQEKQQFKISLLEKTQELDAAKLDLEITKREIEKVSSPSPNSFSGKIDGLITHVAYRLMNKIPDPSEARPSQIISYFPLIKSELHPDAISDLEELGLTRNDRVTKGLADQVARRIRLLTQG